MTNDGGPAVDTSRDTSEQARAYLIRNVIVPLHPTCVPLPDLMGICTQVHNITAGLKAERDAATAERDRLREALEGLRRVATCATNEVSALRSQLGFNATHIYVPADIARAALAGAAKEPSA